jgi:hypothetical protein
LHFLLTPGMPVNSRVNSQGLFNLAPPTVQAYQRSSVTVNCEPPVVLQIPMALVEEIRAMPEEFRSAGPRSARALLHPPAGRRLRCQMRNFPNFSPETPTSQLNESGSGCYRMTSNSRNLHRRLGSNGSIVSRWMMMRKRNFTVIRNLSHSLLIGSKPRPVSHNRLPLVCIGFYQWSWRTTASYTYGIVK